MDSAQDQITCDLDWDAITNVDSFVDGLMYYSILICHNDDPDIGVVDIKYDVEIDMLIHEEIGDSPFQIIICNMNDDTKDACPYFRVIMKDFGNHSTINFKLKTFFDKVGIPDMNARCSKAMIVGLHALHMLDSPVTIPNCFTTTSIDILRFAPGQEIDITCRDTIPKSIDKMIEGTPLCGIYNLLIPTWLPINVQDLIMSYCRSPTADIMDKEINRICMSWDMWLTPMFIQREPRIPAHIAWQYNASNVQNTVANATSYFLVDAASLVS